MAERSQMPTGRNWASGSSSNKDAKIGEKVQKFDYLNPIFQIITTRTFPNSFIGTDSSFRPAWTARKKKELRIVEVSLSPG